MNKKIIAFIILAGMFGLSGLVLADSMADGPGIENPLRGVDTIAQLLEKIGDAVAMVVGALGVIMLIIAGILFVTSAGSPERVNKAKTALFYAIGGIVVALAAKAIVATIKFIIGAT